MYSLLTSQGPNRSFHHIWKAKIPPKIKIWLWLICVAPVAPGVPPLRDAWAPSPSSREGSILGSGYEQSGKLPARKG